MKGISTKVISDKEQIRPVTFKFIHSYGDEDVFIALNVPNDHKRYSELIEKLDYIQNRSMNQMLDAILDYNPDDYEIIRKDKI
jgi:uncharacterized protein YutD